MNTTLKSEKIWRYMDLAKFLNILHQGSLFFPRLGTFLKDPYEGTIPKLNMEEFKDKVPKVSNVKPEKYLPEVEAYVRSLCEQRKDYVFVCPWHSNQNESYLMWKTYCKTEDSVVIVSSTEKVQKVIEAQNSQQKEFLIADKVTYIDFEKEKIYDLCDLTESKNSVPKLNIGKILLYKDVIFNSEQEYRIICDLSKADKQYKETILKGSIGYFIGDLKYLLDEVYVHPESEPWFLNLVNKILSQSGIEAKKSRITKAY